MNALSRSVCVCVVSYYLFMPTVGNMRPLVAWRETVTSCVTQLHAVVATWPLQSKESESCRFEAHFNDTDTSFQTAECIIRGLEKQQLEKLQISRAFVYHGLRFSHQQRGILAPPLTDWLMLCQRELSINPSADLQLD